MHRTWRIGAFFRLLQALGSLSRSRGGCPSRQADYRRSDSDAEAGLLPGGCRAGIVDLGGCAVRVDDGGGRGDSRGSSALGWGAADWCLAACCLTGRCLSAILIIVIDVVPRRRSESPEEKWMVQ